MSHIWREVKKSHSVIFNKIKIFRSITFLEYCPNPLQSFMDGSGIFLGLKFISSIEILTLSDRHVFFFPVSERIKTVTMYKESLTFLWYANAINIFIFSSLSHCLFTPGIGMREQQGHTRAVPEWKTLYMVTPPKILHNLLQGWHCLIALRGRYCTSNVTLSWGAQLPMALQD